MIISGDPYDGFDPFDEYDIEDECEHDEYEMDILTGRASCAMCNHVWQASEAEWKRHEELMAAPYPGGDE